MALDIKFGILPLGTTNDLANNLGILKDYNSAAEVIARGNSHPLDLCMLKNRYFVNNSAVGLEPVVTKIQMDMKYVQGIIRYLLDTMIAILHNPQWERHLEWDSGEYHGNATKVYVGNNPRTEGVIYAVPHADPYNGKLSFVYGSIKTSGEIF